MLRNLDLDFVSKILIYKEIEKQYNSKITVQNSPVKNKFGSTFVRKKQQSLKVVCILRNMVYSFIQHWTFPIHHVLCRHRG